MTGRLLPFALTVSLALATAPGASGATIRADGYDSCTDGEEACVLSVYYDAAPGELNTVTVSPEEPDGGYVVPDSTASLTAGENCTQIGPGSVRCALAGGTPSTFVAVYVRLGDMDDTLTALGQTVAFGGSGADSLLGGPQPDALVGGPGADVLRGGDGDDSLQGDEGPTTTGDDVLDGGAGTDEVTYRDRQLPVTADLRAGQAGSPGEHDRLAGVENVEGGLRANALTGDDGPNFLRAPFTGDPIRGRAKLDGGDGDDQLYGGPRSDRIAGGPGADTLDGGIGTRPDALSGGAGDDSIVGAWGPDHISAGPGNDVVRPRLDYGLQKRGSRTDRMDCGPGADSVESPYRRALMRPSCERALLTNAAVDRPRRTARRLVEMPATLVKARSEAPACALYAELRATRSNALLGRSRRVRWYRDLETTFRIGLTAAGSRRLAGRGGEPIRVRVVHLLGCGRHPDRRVEGFTVPGGSLGRA